MNRSPEVLTAPHIEHYDRDGVVVLRDAFDPYWLELAARGIEYNLTHWGRRGFYYDAQTSAPGFFQDSCSWQRIAEYREYVFESPAAEIAARLMSASRVNLFFENIMVKGPHKQAPTPWHHDVPYWPVEGNQVCSVWMPLDPNNEHNRLRFIKGSHRWGKKYVPTDFGHVREAGVPYDMPREDFELMPDFEAQGAGIDCLNWNLQPGDALVFHGYILHSAPGNPLPYRRRAMITRWCGDDCLYAGDKHDQLGPPFPDCPISPGEPMTCELFPLVWPRPGANQGNH